MAGWRSSSPGTLGHEILDDPVFKRMEGHNSQATTRREHRLRCLKPALQLAQFVIHRNPQRLKGARRRIDRIPRNPDDRRDQFRERTRRRNRLDRTRLHDRARNRT